MLRRLLGSLRDPHTRVYAPGESTDWRVHRYVSIGVAVRELDGQVVVTDVERDSQARRAGLRAGDAVLALDGEPAAEARRAQARRAERARLGRRAPRGRRAPLRRRARLDGRA